MMNNKTKGAHKNKNEHRNLLRAQALGMVSSPGGARPRPRPTTTPTAAPPAASFASATTSPSPPFPSATRTSTLKTMNPRCKELIVREVTKEMGIVESKLSLSEAEKEEIMQKVVQRSLQSAQAEYLSYIDTKIDNFETKIDNVGTKVDSSKTEVLDEIGKLGTKVEDSEKELKRSMEQVGKELMEKVNALLEGGEAQVQAIQELKEDGFANLTDILKLLSKTTKKNTRLMSKLSYQKDQAQQGELARKQEELDRKQAERALRDGRNYIGKKVWDGVNPGYCHWSFGDDEKVAVAFAKPRNDGGVEYYNRLLSLSNSSKRPTLLPPPHAEFMSAAEYQGIKDWVRNHCKNGRKKNGAPAIFRVPAPEPAPEN